MFSLTTHESVSIYIYTTGGKNLRLTRQKLVRPFNKLKLRSVEKEESQFQHKVAQFKYLITASVY